MNTFISKKCQEWDFGKPVKKVQAVNTNVLYSCMLTCLICLFSYMSAFNHLL